MQYLFHTDTLVPFYTLLLSYLRSKQVNNNMSNTGENMLKDQSTWFNLNDEGNTALGVLCFYVYSKD